VAAVQQDSRTFSKHERNAARVPPRDVQRLLYDALLQLAPVGADLPPLPPGGVREVCMRDAAASPERARGRNPSIAQAARRGASAPPPERRANPPRAARGAGSWERCLLEPQSPVAPAAGGGGSQ
jgi:hypothetical protein